MRDINELIGIVKGVDFDGIINEPEVLKLQDWIDMNKDLVCDKKQADLINCIEKIIIKKKINNDDRTNLTKLCSSYLNERQDSYSRLYEFYGIIEGIASDNIINVDEIEQVRKWLLNFKDSINDYAPVQKLIRRIETIIKNKKVSKENQAWIISELRVMVDDARTETIINNLKLLVRRRANIGIYLIDVLDNPNIIKKIHREAEDRLKDLIQYDSVINVNNTEIVFISLVLIAMLDYDGNFFANVHKLYYHLYNKSTVEQKIDGLIRNVIYKYKSSNTILSNNTRIINVALSNSIVPIYYLKPFFDFIFDIYKLNFNLCLSEDLISDFEFVYEGLKNTMLSEGDTINFRATKKTYKLIKTTKELITGNTTQLRSVIRLSILIVRIIDKYYWNKDLNIANPFLKRGFEEWIKSFNKTNLRRDKTDNIVSSRSRWKAKFSIRDSNVYLVPPKHWIKSEYDYKKVKIVVTNNNELLFEDNRPIVREIFGGYEIELNWILLEKPLGNLNYRLICDNKIIYDSKDLFYRSFIFFDDKGEEIFNNTEYSGNVSICYRAYGNEIFKNYYEKKYYRLSQLSIKTGDSITIDDKIFNFSLMIKPGVLGDIRNNYYIKRKNSKDLIPVYYSVKAIVFEKENNNDINEISINGKNYSLNSFKYSCNSREGINKYIVELNNNLPGIYELSINSYNNGNKKKLYDFQYAIDTEINYEINPINSFRNIVTVKSTLIGSNIVKEIDLNLFNVDFLDFVYNGDVYNYYIPLDLNLYKISGKNWTPFYDNLWIGDIELDSELEIYNSEEDTLDVYSNTDVLLGTSCKLRNNGIISKTSIGFLRSYKNNYPYVYLRFKKDGINKKQIICYNQCIFDEDRSEIHFDSVHKELEITPYFKGKGRIYCSIQNENNLEIYKSDYLENGKRLIVKGLNTFRKYNILFKEKEILNSRVISKINRMFFALDDIEGRLFKITEINFDSEINDKLVQCSREFKNVYVLFESREDYDKFKGKICYKLNNGVLVWQNRINPVDIIICSDVIDNTLELAINNHGDGLLLDQKNNGILNSLDDLNATDIYSYIMDVNGVKQDE